MSQPKLTCIESRISYGAEYPLFGNADYHLFGNADTGTVSGRISTAYTTKRGRRHPDVQHFWLCLEGREPDLSVEDLADEFAERAVPGHIQGIVCPRCFDPERLICGSCFGKLPADWDYSEECPHCHRSSHG